MRTTMIRFGAWSALVLAATALGCQKIEGFEDFTAATAGGAPGESTGGAGGDQTGGAAGVATGGAAGVATGGAAGEGTGGAGGTAGEGTSGMAGATQGGAGGSMPSGCTGGSSPGKDGRPMSPVALGTSGTCIWVDQKEVTNADYAKFVADPATKSQKPVCDPINKTFDQDPTCVTTAMSKATGSFDDNPAVCVDWCDAAAYCIWAGKALCAGQYTMFTDASQSDWYAACSSDMMWSYPWGDQYMPGACNVDSAHAGTVPVGSYNDCHGPAGIDDLVGNAAEWVDECDQSNGATDNCHMRGGHYATSAGDAICDNATSFMRMMSTEYLGFRCCSGP